MKRKAIIRHTDIRLFTNDTISQEGEDKEILEEEFLQKQQKKVKPKRIDRERQRKDKQTERGKR